MCLRTFVKVTVGQRFHSGGNLQHTVETHHWPESPVKSENELVEIALQVHRTDSVVRSQEPRIKISKYNVDHREMLVSLSLITSDRYGCVLVAKLVQVIVASPPIGPYFGFLLDVGQNHRFQRFLLAVRDNLEAQPARDKIAAMSSSVLRTLAGRQIRVRAEGFLPREHLYHADNQRFVVPPSSLPLCSTTDVRLVHLDWPLSTNFVSPGPNHRSTQLV
jgi:hypothetical protein